VDLIGMPRDPEDVSRERTQPQMPGAKRHAEHSVRPAHAELAEERLVLVVRETHDAPPQPMIDHEARKDVGDLTVELRAFMGEVRARLKQGQEWMDGRDTKDARLAERIGGLLSKVDRVLGWRERAMVLFMGITAGVLLVFLVMRVVGTDARKISGGFKAAQHAFTSVAFAAEAE
jgi:hypothetical protein